MKTIASFVSILAIILMNRNLTHCQTDSTEMSTSVDLLDAQTSDEWSERTDEPTGDQTQEETNMETTEEEPNTETTEEAPNTETTEEEPNKNTTEVSKQHIYSSKHKSGLFPVPKYEFIDTNETIKCYNECLNKTLESFPCDTTCLSNLSASSAKSGQLCCMYLYQMDCTYVCLSNLSDCANGNQCRVLSSEKNRIIQSVDCNQTTCDQSESSNSTGTAIPTKTPKVVSTLTLFIICTIAVVVVAIGIIGLLYVLDRERHHFNELIVKFVEREVEPPDESVNV